MKIARHSFFVLLLITAMWSLVPASQGDTSSIAVLLEINGPIGPATSDYITRGLKNARERNARLVIIQMDTPGGLDTAMRKIIQEILASNIPVVTYVSPSGARAASAGTYILYASHIAAMAPATNLGSATPIQIGGIPNPDKIKPEKVDPDKTSKEPPPTAGNEEALRRKVVHDAAAYIKGLAQLRGRNAEWAEKAVYEAVSLPASDALKLNVINIVASDVSNLLKQLNGQVVQIGGKDLTIESEGMMIERLQPDWRSKLLSMITNPNIAYILMMIGIYGLIYEFANPGTILPGVTGAICLLLAMYALQVLPINVTGLVLMIIGIAFMLAEVFVPSFGALGIGGVIAFVIGSIMLMDTDVPGFGISLPIIVLFSLTSAGFFMFIVAMAIKARQKPVVSGEEEMLGLIGEALEDFTDKGRVRVHSETWNAKTQAHIHKGQPIKILAVEGLTLQVEPIEENNKGEENSL